MFVNEILRTGNVSRWHMVRTHRVQTVAEHSYRMTMIARDMGRILGLDEEDIAELTTWCLWHDTPESLTGDLPTLTKQKINKEFDFGLIEEATSSEYRRYKKQIGETVLGEIAKLADMMEGMIFLCDEGVNVHRSDSHAYQVMRKCTFAYSQKINDLIAARDARHARQEIQLMWESLRGYFSEYKDRGICDLQLPPSTYGR